MDAPDHVVYLVDDDPRVREALGELLASLGFRTHAFGSAAEYIQFPRPDLPACLILDVELPDMNGLDLQKQMAESYHPPIIFITGYGDIPSSVRAMKGGAVDFLTKPFVEKDLLAAIRVAIARDHDARLERGRLERLEHRFAFLTPRERDVLPLVVGGFLNKQAAAELNISEVTLQIHRSRIMRKMKASSLAELIRMATALKVPELRSGLNKQFNT
jgi:FixJ family two-component response regulator